MCDQATGRRHAIVALDVCECEDAVVILVRGELDASTREVVHDGFASTVTDRCERVVVDASGISFMDCAGWDGLVDAARVAGHEVWLRSPSRPVVRLLELLGSGAAGRGVGSRDEVRLA